MYYVPGAILRVCIYINEMKFQELKFLAKDVPA